MDQFNSHSNNHFNGPGKHFDHQNQNQNHNNHHGNDGHHDHGQHGFQPVQPQGPMPAVPATAPVPVAVASSFGQQQAVNPVPVVKVLSPVGVEYVFLTICLLVGAVSLASVALMLVNGQTDFVSLSFPSALLAVLVPIFAIIFLHLKRLELRSPELKLDPSKRRSTQFTQILSFIVVVSSLVGFVAAVFAKLGGEDSVEIGKAALDALVLLVIFGGLLFYYWHDEHKAGRIGR